MYDKIRNLSELSLPLKIARVSLNMYVAETIEKKIFLKKMNKTITNFTSIAL